MWILLTEAIARWGMSLLWHMIPANGLRTRCAAFYSPYHHGQELEIPCAWWRGGGPGFSKKRNQSRFTVLTEGGPSFSKKHGQVIFASEHEGGTPVRGTAVRVEIFINEITKLLLDAAAPGNLAAMGFPPAAIREHLAARGIVSQEAEAKDRDKTGARTEAKDKDETKAEAEDKDKDETKAEAEDKDKDKSKGKGGATTKTKMLSGDKVPVPRHPLWPDILKKAGQYVNVKENVLFSTPQEFSSKVQGWLDEERNTLRMRTISNSALERGIIRLRPDWIKPEWFELHPDQRPKR
jgi:hypothetical protein